MISIPKQELLDSLKQGYMDFESSSDKLERMNIRGWCTAIEGIIFHYAPEVKEQVLELRSQIIKTPNFISDDVDLNIPSYLRKKAK